MKIYNFLAGTHVTDHKSTTAASKLVILPPPEKVYLALSQHIGAPAAPLVKVGDMVLLGQKIAEAKGLISANIHASVSGKVTAITRQMMPNGRFSDCIIIENDGNDTPCEEMKNYQTGKLNLEEIVTRIKDCGLVGMGGATFPTHVKYLGCSEKSVECVIINGIECEPYLTADHQTLLACAEKIIRGLEYFLTAAHCSVGYIAIEDNKPDAIALMEKLLAQHPQIKVAVCPEKYPQGSEKQLIYAVTEKVVPQGKIPIDVGVIVNNVGTAVAVCEAVENNKPLYERIVTINGDGVQTPGNYLIRVGTMCADAVRLAGGLSGDIGKIISGGPMMGFALPNLDIPITKGSSGLLVFKENSPMVHNRQENNCVRCGSCLDACPMNLHPTNFVKAVKKHDLQQAKDFCVQNCLECGCCSYVCPAHIPIVQYIRLAKQYIQTDGLGSKNALL